MDTAACLSWYVAVSKPRREDDARRGLEEQDYMVFLPLCKVERRHAGKVDDVVVPLYPRYMFVGLNDRQSIRPIENTRGVAFVMRSASGNAIRVPEMVVRKIHDRMGEAGYIDMRSPAMKWLPGQHLRITDGPMAGHIGKFLAECSKERVKVLLSFLGAPLAAEVQAKALEAA